MSIDFSKAFDSIDRQQLISTLKTNKFNSKIIDIIKNIYQNDSTEIFLDKEKITKTHITSGIRQGCNGSMYLFILSTYIILDKLIDLNIGFKNRKYTIPALFYVDDSLLIAQSTSDLNKILEIFTSEANKLGLNINVNKSSLIVFNDKSFNDKTFKEFKVANELKYLGVTISNNKDILNNFKKDKVKKGRSLANMIFSILGRCCNRLLVGKTYWKNLALPQIMYVNEVTTFSKNELNELQKIDNWAYRHILKLPKHTPIECLRGELGSSSAISRDMKTKLVYVNNRINDSNNNSLIKEVIEEMVLNGESKWGKQISEYLNNINITLETLSSLPVNEIKKLVNEWDTKKWQENLSKKSTALFYDKKLIKEEIWLDNSYETQILLRCRTNTIDLNWRSKYKLDNQANQNCPKCNNQIETLDHFIVECDIGKDTRKKYFSEEEFNEFNMGDLLYFTNKINLKKLKSFLKDLWLNRLNYINEIG